MPGYGTLKFHAKETSRPVMTPHQPLMVIPLHRLSYLSTLGHPPSWENNVRFYVEAVQPGGRHVDHALHLCHLSQLCRGKTSSQNKVE
jgi:hypothetical protein